MPVRQQQRIGPVPGGRSLNRPGCLLGPILSLIAADTDPFPGNSLVCPHRCCTASHSPLGPARHRVQCKPQCTRRRMVAQTVSNYQGSTQLLLLPSCPALPISAHLAGRGLCPQGVSAGVSVSIWAPSLQQGEVGEEGSELHRDRSLEGLSGVVHLGSRMPSCLAHCREAAIGSLQPVVLMGP